MKRRVSLLSIILALLLLFSGCTDKGKVRIAQIKEEDAIMSAGTGTVIENVIEEGYKPVEN